MRARMTALLLISMFAAACASAPAPADTAPEGVTVITVENNLSTFSDVTVYVEPQNGVRRSLGVVQSGTTGTFNYDGTGALQFVAQPTNGNNITSETVSVMQPSRIRWVLTTNRLTLSRR